MSRVQKGAIIVLAVVIAFAIGFGWQFARARTLQDRLEQTERDLAFERIENTLAAATIEALRGGHEPARQLASDFFTGLQANISQAPASATAELNAILAERDATITALSRGAPQAGDMLLRLFLRLRVALGGPEQALPVSRAPAATPPAAAPPDTAP